MAVIIAMACVVAQMYVCHFAETFALNCLAKSAQRVKWIDRFARLAFMFSDLCVVAMGALVFHLLSVLLGYNVVVSFVPISG